MATARCRPSVQQSGQLTLEGTGGDFDTSSLLELQCGVTINDLENITIEELPQLEILTSKPDLLSENDVSNVIMVLTNLQNETNKEVQYFYFNFCRKKLPAKKFLFYKSRVLSSSSNERINLPSFATIVLKGILSPCRKTLSRKSFARKTFPTTFFLEN